MITAAARAWPAAAILAVLATLAMLRPVDHDESQYVAAAQLVAAGLLPYRDFGWFQTPLQPLLLAPLAAVAGAWTWPTLRLANAVFGAAAVWLTFGAARAAGVGSRGAMMAAGAFAASDIVLFAVGTARNDALPCALLAGALWLAVRGERDASSRPQAMLAGLLLAAAICVKISYALPAAAYGLWTLTHPRHRPADVALGAVPPAVLLAGAWWLAPDAFVFGVVEFPARAPAQFYAERAWKLSLAGRLVDAVKFLALGLPLPALVVVIAGGWRGRRITMLDVLIAAGLIAAMLPAPTWRQYLLPALPPLFVRAAVVWRADRRRTATVAAVPFAIAGLVPSAMAVAGGDGMVTAMREGRTIGVALAAAGARGPVATLSPQYLPAAGAGVDPRFAPGPFYFRTRGLVSGERERALRLVSARRLDPRTLPAAVLVGGEASAPGGGPALDAALARAALAGGARPVRVAGSKFTLYLRPAPDPPR